MLGRPHGISEDYVNIVGEIMHPKHSVGPYGFDAVNGKVITMKNTSEQFAGPYNRYHSLADTYRPS